MFPPLISLHMQIGLFLCCFQVFSSEIPLGPWHIRHPRPADYARALAHDGQKYVLINGYGSIFTSTSGQNWTKQSTPSISYLASLAYGSNLFVAVGLDRTNAAFLSS